MKKGFTMPEILAAVMIVAILATMAVPMYERAVEKSRLAEVTTTLKRISESKIRMMDDANISQFKLTHCILPLDISVTSNDNFAYSTYPSASFPNAVCAKRLKGDNNGTTFLYLGETAHEDCEGKNSAVCVAYRTSGTKLFCQNGSTGQGCDAYSMDSTNFGGWTSRTTLCKL